jgi:hypothetical protein
VQLPALDSFPNSVLIRLAQKCCLYRCHLLGFSLTFLTPGDDRLRRAQQDNLVFFNEDFGVPLFHTLVLSGFASRVIRGKVSAWQAGPSFGLQLEAKGAAKSLKKREKS